MKQIITATVLAAAAVAVTNPRSASPTPANSPIILVLEAAARPAVLGLSRAMFGAPSPAARSLLGSDVERKEREAKVAESFGAAPFEYMCLKQDSETETEKAIIQEAYEAYMRAVSYVCPCSKSNCSNVKNAMQDRRNNFPASYLHVQMKRDALKFKQTVNPTYFPNEPMRQVSHQERVAKETYQTHFAQPESHVAVALASDAQRAERATKQRMSH